MRLLLLAIALALVSSLAPSIANADTAPDKGHAHVYLGAVDQNGAWKAPHFGNLPAVEFAACADLKLQDAIPIVARHGAKLRSLAAPDAEVVGRLPSGSKVKLLALHQSYGHVWGEVDTSGTRVLAMNLRSYAIDGFTGRSGTRPSTTGADGLLASNPRNQSDPASAPRQRRRC